MLDPLVYLTEQIPTWLTHYLGIGQQGRSRSCQLPFGDVAARCVPWLLFAGPWKTKV
jgi:hypothetical protein